MGAMIAKGDDGEGGLPLDALLRSASGGNGDSEGGDGDGGLVGEECCPPMIVGERIVDCIGSQLGLRDHASR